jgi:hypothetical protein
MTNPLIEKYEELYNPKPPEPPKPAEEPKPRKLAKCYDPDDLKVSFHQVAEQLQTGKAKIASMSMEMNAHLALKTITFEIMVYE